MHPAEEHSHNLRSVFNVGALSQVAAIAAFILLIYSLFLPWWHLDTMAGSVRSPVWITGNIIASQIQTSNWHFIFPILLAGFIALLAPHLKTKYAALLFVWTAAILPFQVEASRTYFINHYLSDTAGGLQTLGVEGISWNIFYPGLGVFTYIVGNMLLGISLVVSSTSEWLRRVGGSKGASLLLAFSNLYWLAIYYSPVELATFWDRFFYLLTPSATSALTALMLWYVRVEKKWKLAWTKLNVFLLLFIPALTMLDALTTNMAFTSAGFYEQSKLVESIQTSGSLASLLIYWPLVILQAGAVNYIALAFRGRNVRRIFANVPIAIQFTLTATYLSTVLRNIVFIISNGQEPTIQTTLYTILPNSIVVATILAYLSKKAV